MAGKREHAKFGSGRGGARSEAGIRENCLGSERRGEGGRTGPGAVGRTGGESGCSWRVVGGEVGKNGPYRVIC